MILEWLVFWVNTYVTQLTVASRPRHLWQSPGRRRLDARVACNSVGHPPARRDIACSLWVAAFNLVQRSELRSWLNAKRHIFLKVAVVTYGCN